MSDIEQRPFQVLAEARSRWIAALDAVHADVLRTLSGAPENPVRRGMLEAAAGDARQLYETMADLPVEVHAVCVRHRAGERCEGY